MIPTHFDFRQLRNVPIGLVLADHGIQLARRGSAKLVGPCPLHGGDNPNAFVVSTARNLWYCFSRCSGGGDVVDLVRRLKRCSYRETARYLAALAQGSPATEQPSPPSQPSVPFQPYTRTLLLDPDTELLQSKGIHAQTAQLFEVGRYHGRGFLAGCVGVRLHAPCGQPLGYAGRRLDLDEARRFGKWKLPPRLPRNHLLYNLHRVGPVISTAGVVLVECPWGVLRLAQLRIPAVALLGVHLSDYQAQLLDPASKVVLLLDGDPAGRLAADRISNQLTCPALTLDLPDGLDPDELSDPELATLLRPFFPS